MVRKEAIDILDSSMQEVVKQLKILEDLKHQFKNNFGIRVLISSMYGRNFKPKIFTDITMPAKLFYTVKSVSINQYEFRKEVSDDF